MLSELQLRQILPLLPAAKAQQYLPHLNDALQAFEINTLLRTAAFIAQTAHESGQYNRLLESLIYSKVAGLMVTWPSRFPSEDSALPYVRNEEKLANFVYAGRMGNGDGASGDGFRYRGRGIIQLTGKDNYRAAGQALGLDLVGEPELAQAPEVAFRVAGLYWKSNKLNELADAPNFTAITQRINGGQTGAAEREKFFQAAQRVLGDGFVASAPATRGGRSSAVIFMLPRDLPPLSRGWQDQPDGDREPAARPAEKQSAAGTARVKKSAAKKPAAKRPAVKKTVAKKTGARKTSSKKAGTKKSAASKATAKKAASRRAAKRSAAGRAPAKKLAVRKAAPKKAATKKPAPKKTARNKTASKPTAAKEVTARRPATKKATAGMPTTKQRPAKKATAGKRTAR